MTVVETLPNGGNAVVKCYEPDDEEGYGTSLKITALRVGDITNLPYN